MMKQKCRRIVLTFSFCILLSTVAFTQQLVQQWDRFELALNHAYSGNAYANVKLTAKFTGKDTTYIVDGFYDGDNVFMIRFMPKKTGTWNYVTSSNVKQLNNKKGAFDLTDIRINTWQR